MPMYTFSASGMVTGMELLKPLPGHMCIDLSGREIAVAEQQLHHSKIGPVVEQMGGKGVAQCMGGDGLVYAGGASVFFDPVPEGLTGHPLATTSGKKVLAEPGPE